MRLAPGLLASSIHLYIRGNERSQQPRPNSSPVVGSVAICTAAGVASAVLRVARCESAKSERGQQVFFNFLYHTSGAVAGQHAVREAHCEDLVGADGWIWRAAIYHVVQASELF